jgi:formylglycine-generating enzyme required for sulfatase activity
MSEIFISYKRDEQPTARKLANALERQGWTVWWDPKLRAGEHFDEVIEKALRESKCVVVMWSKLSVSSRYVKDEATYALKRGKLVPVAIEEVELPFRFDGIHTPVLAKWDGSDDFPEFKKLVDDIKAIIRESAHKPRNLQSSIEQRRATTQPATKLKNRELGTIFRDILKDGTQGPEMIVIPAGRFEMGEIHAVGNGHDKPVHTVYIRNAFALNRYEVTFEEYAKYANAMGCPLPHDNGWGHGRRPVINVSWEDAVKYVKWLSTQIGNRYRLPTEAEWEYAARSGGKDEIWAGTSEEERLADYAVFETRKTEPVGSKNPNGFGLYDMSGNVWEWVEDCWHENYTNAPEDGSSWLEANGGDCERRVMRGGSWGSEPALLRTSSRTGAYAVTRYFTIGFRLAQDLE